MLKTLSVSIAAAAALVAAPAAAQDAEKLALAEQVMEIAQAEQMVDQILTQTLALQRQMAQQYGPADQPPPEVMEQVSEITLEELRIAMAPLMDQLTPLYAEVFTTEELQAMLDFYASPTGQSILEKQGVITQRSMEVSTQWANTAMPGLIQRVQARVQAEVAP